jgi:hypothetical protein
VAQAGSQSAAAAVSVAQAPPANAQQSAQVGPHTHFPEVMPRLMSLDQWRTRPSAKPWSW